MGDFPSFCQSNLPLIYGLYGLAFFVTGIAVALESGRASNLALARALPLLSAFGILQGIHEWIEMFELVQPETPATTTPLLFVGINITLLALSFVFLLAFAARLAHLLEPAMNPGPALIAWLIVLVYLFGLLAYRVFGFGGEEYLFWRVADVWARYVLGISGAVFAAAAMFIQRRAFLREGYAQFNRDLIGAALAFGWYAALQVVVPRIPYLPASVVNEDSFLTFTGMPVQLFRAAVITALAFFIIRVMRVFEIEYARRLEAVNHARFHDQENAARELTVLFETCRIFGTTLDLDILLKEAIQKIVTLVEPVTAGMILLYDTDEHTLVMRVTHSDPDRVEPSHFTERAHQLAQRAMRAGEIAYAAQDPEGALLAIPLLSGTEVIGVLVLAHSGAFANLAVLQTLARQLVIAIENARLYSEVQQKEDLRGKLLERVVSAQEDERKRLARDLHDQTGQVLTALGIGLHSAQQLVLSQPTLAQQRMNELEKMSADAIDELRQFVSELRPALLDDLGLVAALRAMAQQVTDRVGIQVRVQFDGARRRLPPQIETVLYRIAQEALNNTVRHSQAQQATVQLEFGFGVVRLVVQDNGTGFAPSAVMKSRGAERAWGLLGMQERVELVGGKFEVQSAPGQGTCLSVEIPVPIAEGVNVDSTGAC